MLLPVVLLVSCGSATIALPQERDLQNAVFLGQGRDIITRHFTQQHIEFSYDTAEHRMPFSIKGVTTDGIVSVGIGGVIYFDAQDNGVTSYEIRWHLVGP
jgi:hypothetical protein